MYRPEAVKPILDADMPFYRPNGENDFEAILRATRDDENGELLGYGARRWSPTGGARVTIRDAAGNEQVFFVSNPAEAPHWAAERAADLEAYTGHSPEIEIVYPR